MGKWRGGRPSGKYLKAAPSREIVERRKAVRRVQPVVRRFECPLCGGPHARRDHTSAAGV